MSSYKDKLEKISADLETCHEDFLKAVSALVWRCHREHRQILSQPIPQPQAIRDVAQAPLQERSSGLFGVDWSTKFGKSIKVAYLTNLITVVTRIFFR